MKHLFIGGEADGEMHDVHADHNYVDIFRMGPQLVSAHSDMPVTDAMVRKQYVRHTLKTSTGSIDVFVQDEVCPIEAMVKCYASMASAKRSRPIEYIEGGIYDHIGTAEPAGKARYQQCEPLEIYRGKDGRLWYRFYRDFIQRFRPL